MTHLQCLGRENKLFIENLLIYPGVHDAMYHNKVLPKPLEEKQPTNITYPLTNLGLFL